MYGFTGLRSFYGRSETKKEIHDGSNCRGWMSQATRWALGSGISILDSESSGYRLTVIHNPMSNAFVVGVGRAQPSEWRESRDDAWGRRATEHRHRFLALERRGRNPRFIGTAAWFKFQSETDNSFLGPGRLTQLRVLVLELPALTKLFGSRSQVGDCQICRRRDCSCI
jgi:hypothetical protein